MELGSKGVLVVIPEVPVSENGEGGGSLLFKNHFELLKRVFVKVNVVILQTSEGIEKDILRDVHDIVDDVYNLKLETKPQRSPWQTKLLSIVSPEIFAFPFLNSRNIKRLQAIIDQVKPELIWSEHLNAGYLALYSTKIPIVYSHHDWEYKLRGLRQNAKKRSLRYRFLTQQIKRAEKRIVKRVSGVISASITEIRECRKIGALETYYIPTCISPLKTPQSSLIVSENSGLYHLGGMKTTANRNGLIRFFETCWEPLKRSVPEIKLTIIGALEGADDKLIKFINDSGVTTCGFVQDLESALEPYAINIIPWEYNTGTRTKVPFILRSRQVLVCTEASVKGYSELIHNENVVKVRNLNEMSTKIEELIYNRDLRKSLGDKAYSTFEKSFVVTQYYDGFKAFIEKCLK